MVANRGGIAIRAFRATHELVIRTVAVHTPDDDRGSLHRQKVNEAYEIREVGHPVRAYLEFGTPIGIARRVGNDAVYRGYVFLSEARSWPRLARTPGSSSSGLWRGHSRTPVTRWTPATRLPKSRSNGPSVARNRSEHSPECLPQMRGQPVSNKEISTG